MLVSFLLLLPPPPPPPPLFTVSRVSVYFSILGITEDVGQLRLLIAQFPCGPVLAINRFGLASTIGFGVCLACVVDYHVLPHHHSCGWPGPVDCLLY